VTDPRVAFGGPLPRDRAGGATRGIELEIVRDQATAARRGAAAIARAVRRRASDGAVCSLAVSGGRTPWQMFQALAAENVPWGAVRIWQVDERIAPAGDEDRSLTHLRASLPPAAAELYPMPVEGSDLEAAAARYAASLPERFDLVHLGLGDDGHTASLAPGDPVLDVRDRKVALTEEYRGHRRMTLTFPVLDRAEEILWLVTGGEKRSALHRLLIGDPSIPAGRIRRGRWHVVADRAAAGTLVASADGDAEETADRVGDGSGGSSDRQHPEAGEQR
jgi:6-phosphogluconolactonase